MATGFFWDEKCFWHSGGNFAFTLPVGGLVQPTAAGGLPEDPETKRRLKNLMDVTGLSRELDIRSAEMASREDLLRVHPADYLDRFKALSDAGGGQLGVPAPFSSGGYEIAALSAGLACAAMDAVWRGELDNAYSLSRPPGHHCLPDAPQGFCLMANIAIGIEAIKARHDAGRIAVIDWDVHHGNGTEAIFYDRDDVLTISLHQDKSFPIDSGAFEDRGRGAGEGYNINLPLPPGTGDAQYRDLMDRIVIPALDRFAPDMIVVACGYDAAAVDPLARLQMSAAGFAGITAQVKAAAERLCDGRLVLVHEGGYSEVYVPFCGHATIATLAGSTIDAPDPLGHLIARRQPDGVFGAFLDGYIADMAEKMTWPPQAT